LYAILATVVNELAALELLLRPDHLAANVFLQWSLDVTRPAIETVAIVASTLSHLLSHGR
jgi:hypothetical protein